MMDDSRIYDPREVVPYCAKCGQLPTREQPVEERKDLMGQVLCGKCAGILRNRQHVEPTSAETLDAWVRGRD